MRNDIRETLFSIIDINEFIKRRENTLEGCFETDNYKAHLLREYFQLAKTYLMQSMYTRYLICTD